MQPLTSAFAATDQAFERRRLVSTKSSILSVGQPS